MQLVSPPATRPPPAPPPPAAPSHEHSTVDPGTPACQCARVLPDRGLLRPGTQAPWEDSCLACHQPLHCGLPTVPSSTWPPHLCSSGGSVRSPAGSLAPLARSDTASRPAGWGGGEEGQHLAEGALRPCGTPRVAGRVPGKPRNSGRDAALGGLLGTTCWGPQQCT